MWSLLLQISYFLERIFKPLVSTHSFSKWWQWWRRMQDCQNDDAFTLQKKYRSLPVLVAFLSKDFRVIHSVPSFMQKYFFRLNSPVDVISQKRKLSRSPPKAQGIWYIFLLYFTIPLIIKGHYIRMWHWSKRCIMKIDK